MNIKTKLCSFVIASIIVAAVAMTVNINYFAFAQGNIHLDAAAKALQSGDTKGALMHMNEADKTLTGAAKTHLDAAISALQSGDTKGSTMHLQLAQQNQ
jgi:hypothetical protein